MKKSLLAIFLALVMLVSVTACGSSAAQATAAAGTPAAGTENAGSANKTTATTTTTADAPVSDMEQQMGLFDSQMSKLKQKDSQNTWYYTVADLDHDGNLEFLAASQHPQDRSTNLKVWEVSEDRTALTECSLNKDPEESFPDILTDCADTFYDESTDTWYYQVYDNIIISDSEVYTIKTAVNLKDGAVSYDAYGIEHTVLENGWRYVSHTDTNGIAISPEQYNVCGFNAFADSQRSSTNFEWLTDQDMDSQASMIDCYAVFLGAKAPTEVFPVPAPAALQHGTDPSRPTPTPVPTPKEAKKETKPEFLLITKNPTNEYSRKTGGTARFVACSNIYESLNWTIVAPDGGEYSVQNFMRLRSDLSVSGQYSTTLSIGNLSQDMNGWGAYCTFYYRGQTARTSTAYIYMREPEPKPAPAQGQTSGTVYEWNYASVSIMLEDGKSIAVPWDVINLWGDIYVGAEASVFWTGSVDKVDMCRIQGLDEEPAPAPEPGSMSGVANRETDRLLIVYLMDGTTIHLPTASVAGYSCNIYNGSLDDIGYSGGGSQCVVYYMDSPTVENVYQIDVFIETAPGPRPAIEIDTEDESEAEPAAEPEPETEPVEVVVPEEEPAAPQEATAKGKAYHEADGTISIKLDNGQIIIVKKSLCKILSGDDFEDGCKCVVYYRGDLTADNVYKVEIG